MNRITRNKLSTFWKRERNNHVPQIKSFVEQNWKIMYYLKKKKTFSVFTPETVWITKGNLVRQLWNKAQKKGLGTCSILYPLTIFNPKDNHHLKRLVVGTSGHIHIFHQPIEMEILFSLSLSPSFTLSFLSLLFSFPNNFTPFCPIWFYFT